MFRWCQMSAHPQYIRRYLNESSHPANSRSWSHTASASSGLCVTITTSRSLATSLRRSMTCTLVSLSSAPGRLIRQQDIRIIHQCSCYRDSLHLAAGHLVRSSCEAVLPSPTFSSASTGTLSSSLLSRFQKLSVPAQHSTSTV